MISNRAEKSSDPSSYQALLDENYTLKEELEKLKARLQEAEELKRAIHEGDLDALVIYRPEGELIFTLDSADKAYRALVETMNEGTVTISHDGTILYCNRRFAELMKMSPQAIVGASVYQFIAPENIPVFKAFLKQEMISGEINLVANGGTNLPVYLSVSSLKSEGSPNAWCLVATDLTEQKRNEEIVASERLARSIIEQAAEAIIVCDDSGKITRFSNAMTKICKCDPAFQKLEDIIDLRFSEGENTGKSILPVSEVLKGSSILGLEATLVTEDFQTSYLILSSAPLKNDSGKIIGCIVTLTDITERKQAEKALQESEEQHKSFFENSIDAVLLTSPDGTVYAANPAACQIFGMTEEEIIRAGRNGIADSSDPRLKSALEERARTGKFRGELNYKRKDGTIFPGEVSTSFFKDKNGLLKTTMIIRDITERKKAEAKLLESQQRLSISTEAGDLGIHDYNVTSDIIQWDLRVRELWGVEPDELITYDTFIAGLLPDDRATTQEAVDKALDPAGDGKFYAEYRVINFKDGIERWVAANGQAFFEKGKAVRLIGTIQDITERKRVNQALSESRDRLATIFEASPVGIFFSRLRDGLLMDVNWAYLDIIGYSKEEVIGHTSFELGLWVNPEDRVNFVNKLGQQGKLTGVEIKYRRKNGDIIDVSVSLLPIELSGESCLLGTLEDITERKKAEKALLETKQKLALELKAAQYLQQVSTQLIQANDINALYGQILDTGMAVMHADFASIQVFHPERGPGGELELVGFRGFNVEAAKFWEWVNPTSQSTCGVALRTSQRIIVPDIEKCDFMAGSEDLETYLQNGIHAVQTTPLFSRSGAFLGMLSTHWRESYEVTESELRSLDVLARQAADLIERKKAEDELRENKEHFELLSKANALLLSSKDPEAIIQTIAEEVACDLDLDVFFNYVFDEEKEKLRLNACGGINSKIAKEIEWLDKGTAICGCVALEGSRIVSEDIQSNCDVRADLVRSLGVQAYACHPLQIGKKTIGTLSFGTKYRKSFSENELILMRNVADQVSVAVQRASVEKTLFESEQRYRAVIDNSKDAIILTDLTGEGIIVSVNPAATEMFGWTKEEMIGLTRKDILELNDPRLKLAMQDRMASGLTRSELLYKRKDGSVFPGEITSACFVQPNGKEYAVSIIRDVTERKKAEEALQESEARRIIAEAVGTERKRLFDILDTLPAMICLLTPDYKLAFANRSFLEKFGDSGGKPCYEHCFGLSEPCEFCEAYKVFETGQPQHWEFTTRDGSVIDAYDFPFTDIDGSPLILEMDMDITERRKAEEALEKLDKIRIKEIHHRIKNNLQVISSLLSLEAERHNDENMLNAFKQSQSRVTSMALIHEELYRGNRSDTLDFATYLNRLTKDLFRSYNLGHDNIRLKLELESIYLDMDTAIPLGIIVNELVSNSLKHAFSTGTIDGEICITLQKIETLAAQDMISNLSPKQIGENNFDYVLKVMDNGKGVPEKIEFENTETLGFQLVNVLVDQIDGHIELKRGKGTEFALLFSDINR